MRQVRISFSRRTAFALEVTAGEFAGGGRFFAVIDGEREKVLPFLDGGGGDGGDEDDGFAAADGDGAVGEFGEFAGFDDDVCGADAARYVVICILFYECGTPVCEIESYELRMKKSGAERRGTS